MNRAHVCWAMAATLMSGCGVAVLEPIGVAPDGGEAGCERPCGSSCCASDETCVDDRCVSACGTPADLCLRAGAECGQISAIDLCGQSRTPTCGICRANFRCDENHLCQRCESDEDLCARNEAVCGTLTAVDDCGETRTVDCGRCDPPLTCNAAMNTCECVPETDAELCIRFGAECGEIAAVDRCDVPRPVDCGQCLPPATCDAPLKQCVCTPETDTELCTAAGATCGAIDVVDRCGGTRTPSCGYCEFPYQCFGTTCDCFHEGRGVVCSAALAECGDIAAYDSCMQPYLVQCEYRCGPAQTCDFATNKCVCPGETDTQFCSNHAATCGRLEATDSCGALRVVDCGQCAAPWFCDSTTNTCSCNPESDAQLCSIHGATCGALQATDQCGATRTVASCGTCSPLENCEAATNRCVCAPESDAELCTELGLSCGEVHASDRCGMTRIIASCGTCPPSESCDANYHCVCASETDAQFCQRLARCGPQTAPDNCGVPRTVAACTCAANEACSPTGQCVPRPTNDTCANATMLAFIPTPGSPYPAPMRATANGDLTLAQDDASGSCGGAGARDVVYRFTLAYPYGRVAVLVAPSAATPFRPVVHLRVHDCVGPAVEAGCVLAPPLTCTGAGLGVVALQDHLPPGDYDLWVDGASPSDAGEFSLRVDLEQSPVPSIGRCAGAQLIDLTSGSAYLTAGVGSYVTYDEFSGSCATMSGSDVIYTFYLAAPSIVRASVNMGTCSTVAPGLYIRPDCYPPPMATDLACTVGSGGTATVTTPALPSGFYYLVVDTLAFQSLDTFDLTVEKQPVATNDTCGSPELLVFSQTTGQATATGDLSTALDDTQGTCGSSGGRDVVYELVVASAKDVFLTVTPSPATPFRPVVYLRTSCGQATSEEACTAAPSSGSCVPGGGVSIFTGLLVPGIYYVWVDGATATDFGAFTLSVQAAFEAPPRPDPICDYAPTITLGAGPQQVVGPTSYSIDRQRSASCGLPGIEQPYRFTVSTPTILEARVEMDACSPQQPGLYIRSDCATDPLASGSAGEYGCVVGANHVARLRSHVLPIGSYNLFVDTAARFQLGSYSLTYEAHPIAANDSCAAATPVTLSAATPTSITLDTRWATDDLTGSCGAMTGADLVYRVDTPPGKGFNATLTPTAGSTLVPALHLRRTCSSPATEAQCAVESGGTATLAELRDSCHEPESVYLIVDGTAATQGPATLTLTPFTAVWSGDDTHCCIGAPVIPLSGAGTVSVSGDTSARWNLNQGLSMSDGNDIIYTLTTTAPHGLQATASPSSGSTARHVIYVRTSCQHNEMAEAGAATAGASVSVAVPNLAAGTYYLVVDGATATDNGPFTLDVSLN